MTPTPSRLQAMLVELESTLSRAGVRHAIAGGIAMAAHGRVRATEDIDVLVDAVQADALDVALRSLGYAPRASGIAMRYERSPLPGLPDMVEWIDVLLARRDAGRTLIARAQASPLRWQGIDLPVVDPAGLVLMKCLALAENPSRPMDAADAQYLLRTYADSIDLAALERDAAALGADVAAALAGLRSQGVAEAPHVGSGRL